MHLIFESTPGSAPTAGLYLHATDRGIFAHDTDSTLVAFAEGQWGAPAECARLVVHDDAGHHGDNPDADARSWLASWSQSGWEQFDAAFRNASRRAQDTQIQLLIQPSSRGMLSDAVSTLNWCTRGGGQEATLLLDPIGWIVPSMMRDIGDHLERIDELCVEMINQGRVGVVLIRALEGTELREDEPATRLILKGLSGVIAQAPVLAARSEYDLESLIRSGLPNR